MPVRTRFAPSPTGYLHIGGARTALFSYLYARRHGGEYLLRIEDTDRERSTDEAVRAIFDGLDWLGLKSDVEPVFQTQRFDRYREVAQQLLSEGKAYHCYCSKQELDEMRAGQMARKEKPRYDGRCRSRTAPVEGVSPVIRFRNPQDGEVVIDDLIKGRIVFQNTELDDLIIARGDGTPTYNFCVVVDDADMGITHVVRGDDHVNNTPRQINILKALGATPPAYAHVPMILGADGVKLSKRHGAVSVIEYRSLGFLPDALLNYLVRLGWSHGDQELFTREEMIQLFDISRVQQSPARFDMEKALWVNQQYMKSADPALIVPEFDWHLRHIGIDPVAGPSLEDVIVAQRERCRTLAEMAEKSAFFYRDFERYDDKAAARNLVAESLPGMGAMQKAFAGLAQWDALSIQAAIEGTAAALEAKLGVVAQPLRVAVAGGSVSPPIDVTLALLGRERTLARVERAIRYIESL